MKEIVSFFTLAFTSFKFIRRYFDGKKFDFYSIMFFRSFFFLFIGAVLFWIDAILYNKLDHYSIFFDIFMFIDLAILFFLSAIYIATYRVSLNHFILFVDNHNSIFERKNIVSPFSKELMKIQNEKTLVKKYEEKHSIYQYIYNYQIEQFEYIDKESERYKEFVCQKIKGNWKRIFKYNPKIKQYFGIIIGNFLITSVVAFIFSSVDFLLLMVLINHVLSYILNIGFLAKISVSLHRENDRDKVKVMRYSRSFRY